MPQQRPQGVAIPSDRKRRGELAYVEKSHAAFWLILLALVDIVAIAAIGGYVLLGGDDSSLSVMSSQGQVVGQAAHDRAKLQEMSQVILRQRQQNGSLQRQVITLGDQRSSLLADLGQMKSLYSSLRVENSWSIVKEDLAKLFKEEQTVASIPPDLYLTVPVQSDGPLDATVEVVNRLKPLDDPIPNQEVFVSKQDAGLVRQAEGEARPAAANGGSLVTSPDNQQAVSSEDMEVAALEPQAAPTDGASVQSREVQAGELDLTALPRSRPAELDSQSNVKLASIAPQPGFEPAPTPAPVVGPVSGNAQRFLAKMKALQAGQLDEPITILHIGDSHIASDSFTRGIRTRLQSDFGNAGRGAVIPANAFKWAYADGLSMSRSNGWSSANSLKVKAGPYGLSGVRVWTSSPGAKMSLTSKAGSFDWAEVTFYVGPGQGSATVTTEAGSKRVSTSAAKAGSRTVRIEGRSKTLSVAHNGGGRTTVLNWSTGSNKPGIRYVNFGISGATVAVTTRWSDQLIANDIKRIDPDLIIYGYGTNEGYNDNLNMASYRQMAGGLVDKMQEAAPGAALMFIGPADGARRRSSSLSCGGGWYTPAKLGAVRNTLKEMAEDYSALYWDWSSAMGGRCGVAKWSTQNPKLASGDRVHMTSKGYDRSAGAFVSFLERQVKNSLKIASN
ncbi:GDSL-type esterase/lipase family protein [uncultured Cohaesibacter sp.]|uniref:GDSL-type esterase/lipase family protein n=1 Tax=uncultured Cohaesibacter sp. TaxID=1002546 RepID=UPI00292E7E5E|nr:GDSL-type esterase/lipase family protein [uncultured Cohaesibacter sp.]